MAEIVGGITGKAQRAVRDTTGLVCVILGEAAAKAVVDVVKSWAPDFAKNLTDEALASIVGFVMFYFGDKIHDRLSAFGLGVFLSGVGAYASGWVAPLMEMFKRK